jgi:hypothetical protein
MIYYSRLQSQSFVARASGKLDRAWIRRPDLARRADFGGALMKRARLSLLLVVVIGIFAVVGSKADPQAAGTPRPVGPGSAALVGEFRGSGSCSSIACHGSIAPRPAIVVLGNEHTTWISHDKHSRAYETLFSDRSLRIVAKLAGEGAAFRPASEDERCLACHTTPRTTGVLYATRWMNEDGVGCESCHGASSRWLGFHTSEEWRQTPDRGWKAQFGFNDTKSLAARAKVCAGCHVGAYSGGGLPDRDVNHDLIAAGHPRLNFELAASLDNMPPHWFEKDENAGTPLGIGRAANFPARAWAIGQLAIARASLELLRDRAEAKRGPWPEFAEYGCFSCHHDLRDDAWRRPRTAGPAAGATKRPAPGTPAWGSWTMPLARELAKEFIADPSAAEFSRSVEDLTALMASLAPERAKIAAISGEAAQALDRCLGALEAKPMDARQVEMLLNAVNRPEAWKGVASWDEAAQRYLAVVPLYQARLALAPESAPQLQSVRWQLGLLLDKLRFLPGTSSPSTFDPNQLPGGR